jgi:hypothetical protein
MRWPDPAKEICTSDVCNKRIAELEAAVRAALNMVDGNGVPPDWDWMRAVLANNTSAYFAREK